MSYDDPRIMGAAGAVAQAIDYDEFGREIQNTNPQLQPFAFAGGKKYQIYEWYPTQGFPYGYDFDVDFLEFGARDYDVELGRWTGKDPIRFAGGDTNLYAYCGNDPVNCVDPTGLASGTFGVYGQLALATFTGGLSAEYGFDDSGNLGIALSISGGKEGSSGGLSGGAGVVGTVAEGALRDRAGGTWITGAITQVGPEPLQIGLEGTLGGNGAPQSGSLKLGVGSGAALGTSYQHSVVCSFNAEAAFDNLVRSAEQVLSILSADLRRVLRR